MKRTILLALLAPFLMQCASVYHPIDPPNVDYVVHEESEDLDFSYRYDVLTYRHNRKYAKKELKNGINVLSAKITNKTDRTLNFARDLTLYNQQGDLFAVDNEYTAKTIGQNVPIYLLYGLICIGRLNICDSGDCTSYSLLPVGIGVVAGNMILSGTANAKLKREFNTYAPHGKDLGPGETAYVIIVVRDSGYAPLKLKLREKPLRN